MLNNFKFYSQALKPKTLIDFSNELNLMLGSELTKFRSSSSCLIPNKNKDGYLLNVRYVNYFITPSGCYENCDKHITTVNKFVELSKDLLVKDAKLFDMNYEDRRYVGIEDVRIFEDIETSQILFIGTGFHKDNKIGIVNGNYNINDSKLLHTEIKCSFNQSECEKNWVFVDYKDSTHIVYNWSPLQICKLNEEKTILNLILKKRDAFYFFTH